MQSNIWLPVCERAREIKGIIVLQVWKQLALTLLHIITSGCSIEESWWRCRCSEVQTVDIPVDDRRHRELSVGYPHPVACKSERETLARCVLMLVVTTGISFSEKPLFRDVSIYCFLSSPCLYILHKENFLVQLYCFMHDIYIYNRTQLFRQIISFALTLSQKLLTELAKLGFVAGCLGCGRIRFLQMHLQDSLSSGFWRIGKASGMLAWSACSLSHMQLFRIFFSPAVRKGDGNCSK